MVSSTVDTMQIYGSTITFTNASDTELIRIVEDLKKKVRLLRLENEMLEASIMRLQPSLMAGAQLAYESAIRLSRTLSGTTIGSTTRISRYAMRDQSMHSITTTSNLKSRSRQLRWQGSIKSPSSAKLTRSILGLPSDKINVEEKLELLHALMEIQGKDLKKAAIEGKKKQNHLNAQLEEVDIRTKDIEKWTTEFEQEVVIDGVETMTKRIPAETWIRFLTEQGRKIDIHINKLRLRTSTMNTQYIKLKTDIKIKKELSERLMAVDFQVEEIIMKEVLEKIEIKNGQLIDVKALTGAANLTLTKYKNTMRDLIAYRDKVTNMTKQRKRRTIEMDEETVKLASHIGHLERNLHSLRRLRKTYVVPDVMEYVGIKNKISGLKYSIQRLERSLNIKKFAISSFNREFLKSKILFSQTDFQDSKSKKESTELIICQPICINASCKPDL